MSSRRPESVPTPAPVGFRAHPSVAPTPVLSMRTHALPEFRSNALIGTLEEAQRAAVDEIQRDGSEVNNLVKKVVRSTVDERLVAQADAAAKKEAIRQADIRAEAAKRNVERKRANVDRLRSSQEQGNATTTSIASAEAELDEAITEFEQASADAAKVRQERGPDQCPLW